MKMEEDSEGYMVTKITTEIHLPPDFPAEFRDGLVRAVDACYVKKHILTPPEFVMTIVQ